MTMRPYYIGNMPSSSVEKNIYIYQKNYWKYNSYVGNLKEPLFLEKSVSGALICSKKNRLNQLYKKNMLIQKDDNERTMKKGKKQARD